MATNSYHKWKFFRAGGFDQVKISSGADIANLDQLDQKLWVALACPTVGLEFDAKTLALIDTDKDGRIRPPEVIAAGRWTTSLLKNPDSLLRSSPSLPLDAINDTTQEGKQIAASAKQILINLGKGDATAISVDDTIDTEKIFAQTNFNGDGIVPADAAEDAGTRTVINEIITIGGAQTDRSGKPGITQAKTDQFFADLLAFSDWWKKAEGDTNIMPLGEATAAAAAAVRAVKVKVDDYFARCRLAMFDPRAVPALNRQESEYVVLAAKELTTGTTEVANFPLARIEAGKSLPLDAVNPAWAAAVAKLRSDAIKPLLGDKAALSEADWTALLAKLGAFECWSAGKVGASVEPLGLKRVREILAGKSKDAITGLINRDKALEPEANSINAVDRLVRYHRDLYLFCTNFVNFADFYDRGEPAIFQVGLLYLDQRSCALCLPVEDTARHASLAGLAGTYLAYCDCVHKSTGQKRQIVAAFTDGDSDNLMVGRNGIFYDRKGLDWDATIIRLIDNPISVRQAFWWPYKKIVRFIEEQAAKRAADADAVSTGQLQGTVAPPAGSKPAAKKFDVGVVAAMGVAFGAISTFLATVFAKMVELKSWQVALVVVGIIVIISGPSVMIAWLKLRKRNLGPILDANGWAVNAKARMNVPFGKSLTQVASLPPGAQRDLHDPFAEKKTPWKLYLFILILLALLALAWCWYIGKVDKYLPGPAKSTSVMGSNAPAYKAEPAVAVPVPAVDASAATNAPAAK